MNDEVQKIRLRLQELRELHFTGFVNDAQYAESKTVLERKLVDAVMRQAEEAAEAQFAPTQLLDPASLPSALAPLRPPAAAPTWRPWLWGVALLVPLVLAAAWWGVGKPGSSDRGAVAEVTREAVAEAVPPSSPPAVIIDTTPVPVAANAISGTVTLDPAFSQLVAADDTVFVFARAIDGPPVPLAVIRKQVKDLPLNFTLDDSMATWPSASVSTSPKVLVIARISKSGEGQPRKGDLQGQSPVVAAGSTGLQIAISSIVE